MDLDALDLERWLVALGLGAARTVPVTWMIPAFGGPGVAAPVRLGFGLALSLLCLPRIAGHVPVGSGPAMWLLLLAREVAVGVSIGFLGSCIFRAVEAAGRITDTLRGASMSEVISPVSEGRSSPLGEMGLLLTVVIFAELGGFAQLATAIGRSYDAVPIAPRAVPAQLGALAVLVTTSSAQILESALGLAAPAIVALLLADLVLGAICRVAPQVPVYFVGMPLKALAGVGIALVALAGLDGALVAAFHGWSGLIEKGFLLWR